jgi:hypothetical protein
MNVFSKIADLTPVAGFILLVFLIVSQTILLKKKEVKVSSGSVLISGKSILLYSFFTLFLLVFLSGIFTPIIDFFLLPGVLTNFLFDSVLIRISGSVLVLV